jgi:hypothetical protein
VPVKRPRGCSRDEGRVSPFRVPGTPNIAVGFGQAFLTLRQFARRPGEADRGVPMGTTIRKADGGSCSWPGRRRESCRTAATGVSASFAPVLVAVPQRDRDSAELAAEGLAGGPTFLGDRPWADLRLRRTPDSIPAEN